MEGAKRYPIPGSYPVKRVNGSWAFASRDALEWVARQDMLICQRVK